MLLMRRLDRYILLESLPLLFFALLLYSSLSILSMTLPRMQWIVGIPFGKLCYWLLLQYPLAISQTLPLALLLAILLTFGQLTSQKEILAIRAGGIALRRVTYALIGLGIVAAATSLVLHQWILPHTNGKVGALWWEITSGGRSGLWRLAERELQVDEYNLYFERAGRENQMYGVRLVAWDKKELRVIFAEQGKFLNDGLELRNYQLNIVNLAVDFSGEAEDVLRQMLRADNRKRDSSQPLTITTSETMDELITRYSEGGFDDSRSISEVYDAIDDTDLSPKDRRLAAILFHRKLAESLGNFVLLLVAVPLALIFGHNRMIAFGLSLVVALIWYITLTMGHLIAQSGAVAPWLGIWAGNILLTAAGLYLLYLRRSLR